MPAFVADILCCFLVFYGQVKETVIVIVAIIVIFNGKYF